MELSQTFLQWLGRCDYEEALKIQTQHISAVKDTGLGVFLGCQHPTVITLGKRGEALADLLTSMEVLRQKNIQIYSTDRGGQATLHNPGQLVIYPILPLRQWRLGVRNYVECLERATAHFLAEYGVEVIRGYEPGLFCNGRKIAAFGIRVSSGVSSHGLAINIFNDLGDFGLIKQCGQIIPPTTLRAEMAAFGCVKDDWDLALEAEKWKALFLSEIQPFLN